MGRWRGVGGSCNFLPSLLMQAASSLPSVYMHTQCDGRVVAAKCSHAFAMMSCKCLCIHKSTHCMHITLMACGASLHTTTPPSLISHTHILWSQHLTPSALLFYKITAKTGSKKRKTSMSAESRSRRHQASTSSLFFPFPSTCHTKTTGTLPPPPAASAKSQKHVACSGQRGAGAGGC